MGRRAVLADAGPLFAVTDDRDQYHARARRELDRLQRERRSIVVPYPVLWECHSLILRHHEPRSVQSWLADLRRSSFLVAPSDEDYAAAMERPSRYPDQPISLFDALLAVMSDRFVLPVWTYDHHFDVMRVTVWR